MQTSSKQIDITPQQITSLLNKHYASVMSSFLENQSSFLIGVYKRYNSIEAANIVLCYAKDMHLQIIRQKETKLNFDISLNNFFNNLEIIEKPSEKISYIVKNTSIPKETVRRKIKNLFDAGHLNNNKIYKGFYWNLSPKQKISYKKIIDEEINMFAKFTSKFSSLLNLNLSIEEIKSEIEMNFSFYWYHYLSCQLIWLKIWQNKLKDNELLIIVLQAIIPTLQFASKISNTINTENLFKIIGKISEKDDISQTAINAASISDITGIPRVTCIRKLEKLVSAGFLYRGEKTKRYYVNQNIVDRTKNVITKDMVSDSLGLFSSFLCIILNSLTYNKSKYFRNKA
tara:strand:+ start:4856 stop:5884 length:1029 start_codon:yes stop_codon:yes gene_type:complete